MSFGQESLSLKAHKPWTTEAPWILEHFTRMKNESLTCLTSADCLVLLKSPTQASSSTRLCLPCVFIMLSVPPLYNVVSCLISLLSQSPLLDPFQHSFCVTLSEALNGDDSRPITRLLEVLLWLHLKPSIVCSVHLCISLLLFKPRSTALKWLISCNLLLQTVFKETEISTFSEFCS